MARPNKVGGIAKPVAQKPFCKGGKLKAKGGKITTKKKKCC